jgi:hypothetical protein
VTIQQRRPQSPTTERRGVLDPTPNLKETKKKERGSVLF